MSSLLTESFPGRLRGQASQALGPLPPKGAQVPAPEADLGGLERPPDPAFVFSSQKKSNNRGSDGAKDCLEPAGGEASASHTRGRPEGSAAGGEGRPWKRRERGGEGARGLRLTDGRAGGGWAARGPHRGSSKRARRRRARAVPILELDLADAAVLVEQVIQILLAHVARKVPHVDAPVALTAALVRPARHPHRPTPRARHSPRRRRRRLSR